MKKGKEIKVALLLLIGLYIICGYALSLIVALHTSYTLFGLVLNIACAIGAVVIPIIVYSIIDSMLTKRAVSKVGFDWCSEHHVDYVRVETFKNHFAVLYSENGKQQRAKFRAYFQLSTWNVKKVEWLNMSA